MKTSDIRVVTSAFVLHLNKLVCEMARRYASPVLSESCATSIYEDARRLIPSDQPQSLPRELRVDQNPQQFSGSRSSW